MKEEFIYRAKYDAALAALEAEERLQVYDALFDCLFHGQTPENLAPRTRAIVSLILYADFLESELDKMAG